MEVCLYYLQVISSVGLVVAWRIRRGGSVSRVSTERSLGTPGDLELVCNEAVPSRGREPGFHPCCICFWLK